MMVLKLRRLAVSLLSLLIFPLEASTQQPVAAPSPDLAGIAHVAIRVHDLDASVAFYEKLGFIRAFALSRDGKTSEVFLKIDDQQFLELYPVDDTNPQAGFLHVCFYAKNLQSVHDYYVAQGLAPTTVRTAGAGNLLFTMPGSATLTGPQNMEYTQYMPASMHSKVIGQFLGPDRISTHLIGVEIAVVKPAEASAFYKDKAGFIPKATPGPPERVAKTLFAIPGNSAESIQLVSAASLGFRARVILAADATKAAAALKQRDIPFIQGKGEMASDEILVTDPDGNQFLLHPER